mmetsp:Transcript_31195/g.38088  ORF Transcript_31195/g.38088 Transcript_31195/m.38088 type:complete len:100 (+) Transcript_31195:846-1145(+)
MTLPLARVMIRRMGIPIVRSMAILVIWVMTLSRRGSWSQSIHKWIVVCATGLESDSVADALFLLFLDVTRYAGRKRLEYIVVLCLKIVCLTRFIESNCH